MDIVKLDDIRIMIKNLNSNKREFRVEEKRGNKLIIFDDGKEVYYGLKHTGGKMRFDINENLVFSFVGLVKQQVNRYLAEHKDDLCPLNYHTNGVEINHELFDSIAEGGFFWETDIEHAYFQAMHSFGYISDKFYERYKRLEEYKQAYIFSVSWMQADKTVYYYKDGKLDKEEFVSSDVYSIIYDNVREKLSMIIDGAVEECGDRFFRSTVDSVMYACDVRDKVKEYFRGIGFEVKHTLCRKIAKDKYFKSGREYSV
jgi:hypothetical protein